MQELNFGNTLRIFMLATLITVLCACGGAGSGDDSVEELPDPPTIGILFEGNVNAMASEAMRDYDAGDRTTSDEISVNSDGIEIDRTNISIAFVDTASIGEMNVFLDSINAKIVSMLEGVNIVLVRIPDPQDLATLDTLIQQIESNPLIRRATKADMGGEDSLPGNYNAETSDLTKIDHHIAVLAPAAWNAKAALLHPGASAPLFLQADSFGGGIPNNTADINVLFPGDFALVNTPGEHGYHVLGIVSGRHNEFTGTIFPGDLVTGIYPGTIDVRVVDAKVFNRPQRENKLVSIIKSTDRNVVLNTSLHGACPRSLTGDKELPCIKRQTRDWLEKVRGSTPYNLGLKNPFIESSYLHLTSAGNFRPPKNLGDPVTDNKLAELNSQYSAAKLMAGLSTFFGIPVPNTSNTLVVENRVNSASPNFLPGCLSPSSKKSGDISAIGRLVWSSIDAGFGVGNRTGTSMSTPQVAGLSAYVWALNPALFPEDVIGILKKTSKVFDEDKFCDDLPASLISVPAPVIDAYAAVLAAIDTPDAANSAPVRFAILDIADSNRMLSPDMVFDEHDIARYIAEFDNRDGQKRDFSRFDLNGDGYTGGKRKARFNLDMDPEHSYSNVVQPLPETAEGGVATDLSFDENWLTDLEILCYYGFSSLFTGDTIERDADLIDECVPVSERLIFVQRDSLFNFVGYVTMNPDGSDQLVLPSNVNTIGPSAWSPDRSKILFTGRDLSGRFDIFSMNADGTDIINLTNNPNTAYLDPYWSPDGTQIVFSANAANNNNSHDKEIYRMDADGSNVVRLTSNSAEENDPIWSPDGTKIAFEKRFSNGSFAIYSMNPDGTNQQELMSLPIGGNTLFEEWSPDSAKLIFNISSIGISGIYIMDSDGSNLTLLPKEGSRSTWSPDGEKIASADNGNIYIMNPDGSNVIEFTSTSGDFNYNPRWSADSQKIFFNTTTDAFTNNPGDVISRINRDGSNLTTLTNDLNHSWLIENF